MAMVMLTAAGCSSFGSLAAADWLTRNPFEKTARANLDDSSEPDRESSRLVNEYVTISGMNPLVLNGVGLVTGLRNTGGDIPPSNHRRNILDEMRRRKVPNPNRILQSPTTAVVNVRVFVPPLARKGEILDVEVSLPEGSEATSLRGGMLLECSLYESAYIAGRGTLRGDELARGAGRVLITAADERGDEDHLAGVLRRGVVPGGARYIGEPQTLGMTVKTRYRSNRMSRIVARQIGVRFHDFDDDGLRKPLAEAKTDTRIELKVPRNYRDNYQRYLQVVRRVPVKESPIERRVRIEKLRAELAVAETASEASMQLEAIGREAIPVLREGLEAANELSRFHAAAALAYLGEDAGVDLLVEAARTNRTARVWALLAMASLRGGEAIPGLATLLDDDLAETRYGAVRAITTVDEVHHAVAPERIGGKGGQFIMRTIPLDDPAARASLHITKRKKAELCVFAPEQEFRLPMLARAGSQIMVVGRSGDRMVEVTRFVSPESPPQTQRVPARLVDVIRTCCEMDATYPDIVGLLMEADRQHNLPGELAIDTLPSANRRYADAPTTESTEAFEGFDSDTEDTPSEATPSSSDEAAATAVDGLESPADDAAESEANAPTTLPTQVPSAAPIQTIGGQADEGGVVPALGERSAPELFGVEQSEPPVAE